MAWIHAPNIAIPDRFIEPIWLKCIFLILWADSEILRRSASGMRIASLLLPCTETFTRTQDDSGQHLLLKWEDLTGFGL